MNLFLIMYDLAKGMFIQRDQHFFVIHFDFADQLPRLFKNFLYLPQCFSFLDDIFANQFRLIIYPAAGYRPLISGPRSFSVPAWLHLPGY